jgi:energy-converting hydrogenase Eha subunit A
MVGYVILIIIAIAVSILVYAFLKVWVPKDKPECLNDVTLIVEKKECVINSGPTGEDQLTISLCPS